MKLLKCGMACCVFLSIVAWQTKYTSLQPTDAKGFIVEIQKKYAEVQAVKERKSGRDRKQDQSRAPEIDTYLSGLLRLVVAGWQNG